VISLNQTIKAVIWDMGGVLLHEADSAPRKKLAQQYGVELIKLYDLVFNSQSAALAARGEISEEEHWRRIAVELGVPPADLENFHSAFWSGDEVDSELIQFIRSLRPTYKTALLSNAWTGTRKALDEYYGCLDIFDEVVISAEIRLAKPDPAIYRAMLTLLDLPANQTIFVDDLAENIEAANALGIHGIRFENTRQAIQDVRRLLDGSSR
jgi:epoxide hydrolase-like predicted phosphatase